MGRAPVCFFFAGPLLTGADSSGEAETVALVSEEDPCLTETPPAFSSSELSSDEESESEDSGRDFLVACLRALESAFFAGFSSESEDSESEDSESEDEEAEESEEESDSEELSFLAFLVLWLSFSDSESESESELESEDDELLDSAFRFTPVDFFAAGAGTGAASSSSSSSASLSELEDDEDGEAARADF